MAYEDIANTVNQPDIKTTQISICNRRAYILKAKSNFTLVLYIPFLGIGEWYFKCI